MKSNTPFQDKLTEYQGKISPHMEEAAFNVTDTLILALAADNRCSKTKPHQNAP